MDILGSKVTVYDLAKANKAQWYGYDDSVLRVALDLEWEKKARKIKENLHEEETENIDLRRRLP